VEARHHRQHNPSLLLHDLLADRRRGRASRFGLGKGVVGEGEGRGMGADVLLAGGEGVVGGAFTDGEGEADANGDATQETGEGIKEQVENVAKVEEKGIEGGKVVVEDIL
jgi:hypothetical protein